MLKKYKVFIFVWWVILLLIIAFVISFGGIDKEAVIDKIKSIVHDAGFWGPLFFILIYQIRFLLFLPISLLSALAGVIWGLSGLVYVLIALALCATTEFVLARYFFREKVQELMQGKIDMLAKKIERNAFFSVFLIRLVPNIMFDIQNCALAMTKVHYKDYITGTLLGMFFGTFALVFFGDSLSNIVLRQNNATPLGLIFIIVWGSFVIYLVARGIKKYFKF
jgi:uncharacterized membrane protein YdjX (TVP38/TMEM64 family)